MEFDPDHPEKNRWARRDQKNQRRRDKVLYGSRAGHKESVREAARPAAEGEGEALPLRAGLYLVATPIGNVGDIGKRALDILGTADLIACEDSRKTGALLHRLGLAARPAFFPYHDHNADQVRPELLARMQAGAVVALVSDAGLPLVADPGYKLTRDAIAADLYVTAIPGANAALTALQVSGLPPDRFLFAGFLPPKSAARKKTLAAFAVVPVTLIFYETGPRLAECLADMVDVLGGERPMAVARELTKTYEEIRRGPLADLARAYADEPPPKGELTLVIGSFADKPITGE